MPFYRKLGVFVKVPAAGRVKTRLVPPLDPDEASSLYFAFVADLLGRLEKLKKVDVTVFFDGQSPAPLAELAPARFHFVQQMDGDLGQRLEHAFAHLLDDGRSSAVVIGSDSPDLPLAFIKRAFQKLKHKPVALGPAADGGYYMIGLQAPRPELFRGPAWGTDRVFGQTLGIVRELGLQCSLLPLWYDVDDIHTLTLLHSMIVARRIERRDRLPRTERVIDGIVDRMSPGS